MYNSDTIKVDDLQHNITLIISPVDPHYNRTITTYKDGVYKYERVASFQYVDGELNQYKKYARITIIHNNIPYLLKDGVDSLRDL